MANKKQTNKIADKSIGHSPEPKHKIITPLQIKDIADIIKKAETFGELYNAGNLLSDIAIPTPSPDEKENTLSAEWEQVKYMARQKYRILHHKFSIERPDVNLPSVPSRNDCDLTLILGCCTEAEKLLSSKPDGETDKDGEVLMRIEAAIIESGVKVGHTIIKRAARKKEIYSERSNNKTNSPYLVYASEIKTKFAAHGTK